MLSGIILTLFSETQYNGLSGDNTAHKTGIFPEIQT